MIVREEQHKDEKKKEQIEDFWGRPLALGIDGVTSGLCTEEGSQLVFEATTSHQKNSASRHLPVSHGLSRSWTDPSHYSTPWEDFKCSLSSSRLP